MKYCANCGKELADDVAFCSECGAAQQVSQQTQEPVYQQAPQQQYQAPQQSSADSGSFGWAALGFCFPIVGLVLYLVWKGNKPLTAKKAGIGALVGFCLNLLLSFIGGLAG